MTPLMKLRLETDFSAPSSGRYGIALELTFSAMLAHFDLGPPSVDSCV
jgi:hypothetical protein